MVAAWRRRCGPQGQRQSQGPAERNVRDLARILERYNPFAQSMLSALRSYVLADQGMAIEVMVKEGLEDDSASLLAAAAQEYLDMVMDEVDGSDGERELVDLRHC